MSNILILIVDRPAQEREQGGREEGGETVRSSARSSAMTINREIIARDVGVSAAPRGAIAGARGAGAHLGHFIFVHGALCFARGRTRASPKVVRKRRGRKRTRPTDPVVRSTRPRALTTPLKARGTRLPPHPKERKNDLARTPLRFRRNRDSCVGTLSRGKTKLLPFDVT